MKYIPINAKDRSYIEYPAWNKKYLRAVQCILQATHGVVSPNKSFFNRAFGENLKTFMNILLMPEDYIIYRKYAEDVGLKKAWKYRLRKIKKKPNYLEIMDYIYQNKFKDKQIESLDKDAQIFINHYTTRINVEDYRLWKYQQKNQ